ncbi:MAG TPA: glycosyltransferase family 2 protein [Pseudorhodoferax sp.]|jgi:glycosyltransferase involved in cell wall biosynthesis|nr:glycosyltransferase family 2 protein [Pseudorhodoferax sp.]
MSSTAPTPTLSVIIAAKNEARNIADCVRSASFADEILVLDSGSTDATAALAAAQGARVVATDWPGYGPQQQRGIAMARCDWVLSLDADERISPALQAEIRAAMASGSADGFRLPRLSSFCGKFIHHSGWRPDYTLRLVRREKAGFTAHLLHAHMTVDGTRQDLQHDLVHYSYHDLDDVLEKLNRYSTVGARDMHARGKKGSFGSAIVHGLWAFVRTYVLRRGFLDGRMGFMLSVSNAEGTYYRYLKLWLAQREAER